jgi:hypothetical protein
MPLASILSWLGMTFGNQETFAMARLPFILVGSVIPPLVYWLSWSMSAQRFVALFATLLAWLPMFYLAYLPTTDTFAIYMVLGTLWLILAGRVSTFRIAEAGLAGIVCGLMHLARADGLVWTLLFCLVLLWDDLKGQGKREGVLFGKMAVFLISYGVVMGGWYVRNLLDTHSLFPPGNQRSLFLHTYNDLFRYPPSDLNLEYFLRQGMVAIVSQRFYALGQNLMSFVAVQMEILLTPLFLLGYWRRRGEAMVKIAGFTWLVMLGLMSLVFPFAGWRGGYFHLSAAFQPLIWCLSAEGFTRWVQWGVEKRKWNASQSLRVFSLFMIGFLLILTASLYAKRVIGSDFSQPKWQEDQQRQGKICRSLRENLTEVALQEAVILINNPIGFYLSCQIPAVAVPVGGEHALRQVASRFGAKTLVLERDHPAEFAAFFISPHDSELLTLIESEDEWKIYRINESP